MGRKKGRRKGSAAAPKALGKDAAQRPTRVRHAPAAASVEVRVSEADASLVTVAPVAWARPLPPPRRVEPGAAPPADAVPASRRHAHYRDEGEVGRGGMSTIRVALDERLGRRVAMKRVDLPLVPGSKEARRFLDEAQITGQLDHPNIVPIHDLGLDARGAPTFFTMKLVRGRDLGARLDELGAARLEAEELEALVRVLVRVCDAVSFAHSLGVIHRDLKPRNVMIGAFGQVYVMDWGLALVRAKSEHPPEERSHAIGTPAYMAPEQAWPRFEAIDERTDVYGLGGILYTVLTGTAPHGVLGDPIATVLAAREGVVRAPEELAPRDRLPPELCRIAMKALAPDPRDRYQAVPELELELEAFLRGGGWLETRVYEPGAVIVREGDEAEEAFIVTGGACEVVRTTRGRSHVVGRMGVGEVFGETMLLEGQRRQATVRAVDRVTVKVVTRDAMRRELAGRSFLGSFLSVLADRFRETATELEALRGER